MLTRAPHLRLASHGGRLRLRQRGRWYQDPLAGIRECSRASIAVDKALGEAVRQGVASGASWREIGRALGVTDDAQTQRDVLEALAEHRRAVWRRFWYR